MTNNGVKKPNMQIEEPEEIETGSEMVLQKLSDVEEILSMQLRQDNKYHLENKENTELLLELVGKVILVVQNMNTKENEDDTKETDRIVEAIDKMCSKMDEEHEVNVTVEIV